MGANPQSIIFSISSLILSLLSLPKAEIWRESEWTLWAHLRKQLPDDYAMAPAPHSLLLLSPIFSGCLPHIHLHECLHLLSLPCPSFLNIWQLLPRQSCGDMPCKSQISYFSERGILCPTRCAALPAFPNSFPGLRLIFMSTVTFHKLCR